MIASLPGVLGLPYSHGMGGIARSSNILHAMRTRRWLMLAVALMLVFAQALLAAHTVRHAFAEPDEQHHCPLCKLADHSPALASKADSLPGAPASATSAGPLRLSAGFSAPRSKFLARAPPA